MAKDKEKEKPEAESPAEPQKKMKVKTVGLVAGVLLLEALIISSAFFFAGKPADVKGDAAVMDEQAAMEKPVEVLVVADKFQNAKSGRTYLYDTEVYIVIRKKYEEKLNMQLEAMRAQITTDISRVFRRAEPTHLLEPTMATITRQIEAALEERLGPDEAGESRIDEVLISKCTRFRSDM